jgi:hypothetical protein
MERGQLQRPIIETVFTAQVTQVGQINENSPEYSELGKGIDMVCVEPKFNFLHVPTSNRESYSFWNQRRLGTQTA